MQILERNLAALLRADPARAHAVAACPPGPDLEVRPARRGGVALARGVAVFRELLSEESSR